MSRPVIALAFAALAWPAAASAQDIPVRGVSSTARLAPAQGLKVQRVAQLRMDASALSFVEDTLPSAHPVIALAAGDCIVRAEDRNRDGIYESVSVRIGDRPAPRCPKVSATYTNRAVEAGENVPALSNCRLSTRDDYTIACQPTRFGRDNGEAWTILSGFADRHGRHAMGRPDDLSWDEGAVPGLLVLDGPSGVIYRLDEAPFVPRDEDAEEPALRADVPKPPSLVKTSGLSELPVTRERQKIMDDQEATFSKYRPETEELPDRYAKARERHRKRAARTRPGSPKE